MDITTYMARRCMCGATRAEHSHCYIAVDGIYKTDEGNLRVLAVMNRSCTGFLDEFERELTGNPLLNKHLGPILQANLDRAAEKLS